MNRIVVGDNLSVMRGMSANSVDLIYLDPPFNSKKTYSAPIGSKAAGAAFKDTWTLDDVDHAWLGEIAETSDGLYAAIQAAGHLQGDGTMAYLTYMAVRLLEMKRLLKDTGSIYLHCDPTASHYLKLLLDGVFGGENFRNEITWKRIAGGSNRTKNKFANGADRVFFYAMHGTTYNGVFVPHSEEYLAKTYRHFDSYGRYCHDNLTQAGATAGDSSKPWRGIDMGARGKHWLAPRAVPSHVEHPPSNYAEMKTRQKLDWMDSVGLIYWPSKKNGMPRFKRYHSTTNGTALSDVWTDIAPVQGQAVEKLGYPTQKPIALLERIIKASSNEGDLVLDPFCGCATTCVAADKLNRKWIGIDISSKAGEIIDQRMKKELGIFKVNYEIKTVDAKVDPVSIEAAKSKRRNRRYNSPENKRELFGRQSGRCAACGYEARYRQFHVDHIVSQHDGGSDALENLQLLDSNCNGIKGGKRTQRETLDRLVELRILTADEAVGQFKRMKTGAAKTEVGY